MKVTVVILLIANVAKIIAGFLAIQFSDTDSEREFSILRKRHRTQSSNLDRSTVVGISLKFNCDDGCHDIMLEQELLKT